MELKNISVKDLIPYEKNTKKHDDVQINNVAESIKQYGFVQPIVIDKNNVVVIGHCRLLAAKKLKMADVPCVCVEDLTEEQVKALRIVDNKSNESPWDFDFLADELADLDLSDFDFDFGIDTDAEEETEIVEDEAPEVDEENEPITKLGDIWQLGRHRLMCGDSTDKATVEKLMDGNKADMVFTDPPYGMKKEADGVLNDNLNYDDLLEFNKKWIPLTFANTKENGSWYCWGIDEPLMDIYRNILKPMAKKNEIKHSGKILEITPDFTTVQIVVSSACSSCHAKGLCGMSEDEEKVIMVPTDPYSDHKVGDEVQVLTKMTMGLKAVWISYVIPLAVLMILILSLSSVIGNELVLGLVSIAGVALYYFGIWLFRDRLSDEFVFYIA